MYILPLKEIYVNVRVHTNDKLSNLHVASHTRVSRKTSSMPCTVRDFHSIWGPRCMYVLSASGHSPGLAEGLTQVPCSSVCKAMACCKSN